MPLSPSMNVIALRHAAVFMNAGSYVIRPKSPSPVLSLRRPVARIVPSAIGMSVLFPVRLSVMVSVSLPGMERGNLSDVARLRSDQCHRCECSSLRAQSARSELVKHAAIFARESKLIFGPAAFGADEKRCRVVGLSGCRV